MENIKSGKAKKNANVFLKYTYAYILMIQLLNQFNRDLIDFTVHVII